MEGFIFRKGFIQGVHMYLWQDSYVGEDSYQMFTYIDAGIDIYLWWDSYLGRDSYKQFTYMYIGIHKRTSHRSIEGFI